MNSVLSVQCALCIVPHTIHKHMHKSGEETSSIFSSPILLLLFTSFSFFSYKLYYIIESFFCWLTMFSFFYRFIPVRKRYNEKTSAPKKWRISVCFFLYKTQMNPRCLLLLRMFCRLLISSNIKTNRREKKHETNTDFMSRKLPHCAPAMFSICNTFSHTILEPDICFR